MNTSKSAIVVRTIIGKVCSIIGYSVGALFLLCILIAISENDATEIVVSIFFLAAAALLIVIGIRTKRMIERFRLYVGFISMKNVTSLEDLASSTSQPIEFVRKDIQKMISKRFFTNAYLNRETNQIVIGESNQPQIPFQPAQQDLTKEIETVKCPGCGAMNQKRKGASAHCEYCGSSI